MSRVLAIGDVHAPVQRDDYLIFCQDLYDAWDCDKVVFIGDVVDWHGISFHARHPDGPGTVDEYNLAKDVIAEWYEAFPEATIILGNHDERITRKAEAAEIPSRFIRSYSDIWETPEWNWTQDTIIDDVYYMHGDGAGGGNSPAALNARQMAMSVVCGHFHRVAGVQWMGSPRQRWFGLDTGCGIDDTKYAFAYGRKLRKRPIIAAGVIIDGVGYSEPMPLEKYK
jgi:metallophosphoesterase superfamily enzyme